MRGVRAGAGRPGLVLRGLVGAALVAGGVVPGTAAPSIDGPVPKIIHSDGPLAVPPGSGAFGPNGPVTGPRSESALPPKADPPPSAAARRKTQIDDLFDRLAKAQDPVEAAAVGGLITQVLQQSGSDTADLLMHRAIGALDAKDYATATALLDKLVALQPRWAEAWNKRATVRYLDDDDTGSMADIGHVLALEPRHFGALSGMGLILHRNGDDKGALEVFRRAATINPQDAEVKHLIEQLVPAVEGHDL